MSTLKIEHIANIANSGPDISIDTNGHLNIVNGSLQMGGTTMLDTSDTTLKNVSKIGIGTASPGYKLQVDHGTTAQYASSIRNTADNLQLLLGTTTGGLLNIQGKTINSNAVYQISLQSEGGNVGIGTTTTGARKVRIVGSSSAYPLALDSTDTDYQLEFQKNGTSEWWIAASASSFKIHENGVGDKLTILSGGNVGIGVTNPSAYYSKDLVLGAVDEGGMTFVSDPAHRAYIMFADGASGGNERYRGQISYDHANDQMSFTTAASTAVTIDSSGDIGVGVVPYANARLTIGGGDGGGYPAVLMYDNNNSSGAEFFMLATDTNWVAGSNKFIMGHGAPSSSNTDVTIDSNGYVGINTTSPQRALHIHDHSATGLHITNTQSGAGANDGFSQYIRDDNQATELMVRENSYLGFGTNNTLRAKILSSGELFWPEISNRGDLTFPICSISNNGSGGQYLHAQFQSYGGVMLHISFKGYDYTANIKSGSGGTYVYNTAGQQVGYSRAFSGDCVEVYQTTTNRVELVINTGGSATGNRWGSMVFFGGTDTITGDTPLTLVQYGWNGSTSRMFSS
tara:strand:+ start:3157 stop:4863 length:1707 start_codon:yes stop_codon:yes gene_type:complete